MAMWRWARACEMGARHKAAGGVCEDASLARRIETGCGEALILAVADGAGSSRLAQIGSEEATCQFARLAEDALEAHSEAPDEAMLRDWLEGTRAHLERVAEVSARRISEFSTTLLAVILSDTWSAFVQIGDGAIVRSGDEAGEWAWMFLPHKGAYVNETVFLTHPDAAKLAHVSLGGPPPDEIALFTDGLEHLLIREGAQREVVEAFFNEMMVPVRALEAGGEDGRLSHALCQYLSSPAITARTDDDTALILATRRPLPLAEGTDASQVRTDSGPEEGTRP